MTYILSFYIIDQALIAEILLHFWHIDSIKKLILIFLNVYNININ